MLKRLEMPEKLERLKVKICLSGISSLLSISSLSKVFKKGLWPLIYYRIIISVNVKDVNRDLWKTL